MARYTYDQFRQNAQSSGLLNEFSQADLQRAQQDPDFGMSILNYKKRYHNATSDADRAAANRGAEELRSSWGGYTGGQDGSSFVKDVMSPSDFQYGSAPTYSGSAYDNDIADLWDAQKNFGDFTFEDAPVYNNRYDDTIQDLIQGILDRPDFSYDPETDLLYQQYRKQYNREGDRATADALGAAAAVSGGLPSSYANTAAAQAGNYYAAQLTDKIPELYELAYNKYLNDYNMANQNLQTALGLQDNDFNQYLAALDQFNTDRNFAYGQFTDELTSQANDRANTLEEAILQAEMGDYSGLASLGWDTSDNPLIQQQNADAQALAQAQIDAILSAGGTPSADLIAQSGYSQEYVNALRNAYLRELTSQIGSPGGGRVSGGTGNGGGYGNDEAGSGSSTQKKAVESIRENINLNRPDSTLSPAARSILTSWQHVNPGTSANVTQVFADRIESALNSGSISEEDARYLMAMMGYQ